jgi:nicotinate-nucleotide adenylyltransferase
MGGTFDPAHIGHLVAASEALHAFALDLVLFMPAGRPWQKSDYSDPEDRLMMAMLAASCHPRFAVSRMELDRTGPTYTADTMEALRDFYGDSVQLFFIAGADAIQKLGTWRGVERLKQLAEMIAVTRSGYDISGLEEGPGWPRIHTLEIPGIAVSSTLIRRRVRDGKPIDFLVPAGVADYIREHGLYAGAPRSE